MLPARRLPAVLYVSKGDMKVTAMPEDTPKLAKQITQFITGFAGEVSAKAGALRHTNEERKGHLAASRVYFCWV